MQMTRPSWNPLKCRGTDLPLNLTVMIKVLALVVLLVNHVRILPDPWLPFIPGLDRIPPMLFQRTIQTAFLISAIAIVFNRRVRLASLVLGATMLLAVVSSKAYYGNNKTFCGLMFLFAGLYQPGGPNFIRWQLAVTYFGAGLNKALEADWHSGVFFENWAAHRLQHPWYIALDSKLPPLVLAKFMCWTTIVTELGTVPCLLIPSVQYWAVLANILFQSGLLLFTGTTFTLFFYSMTAASFAFFTWPEDPVRVFYDEARALSRRMKIFFSAWDFDGIYQWVAEPSRGTEATGPAVRVLAGSTTYSGFRALRMLLLLNPVTYFVIAGSIAAFGDLPGSQAALYRRLIAALSLILLMPPLARIADMLTGGPKTTATVLAASARTSERRREYVN
jgi:hypothetical protein